MRRRSRPESRVSPEVSTHDRATGILADSLKDKNPDTRMHAVQALGLLSPSEPYLSQLEGMLDDKDMLVRLATITSLVDLKNQRTVPTLQKALASNVPEVSFAAAKALWALDDPSGHDALVSVLSGENKTSSGFITKEKRDALRMLHTPQTLILFAVKEGATSLRCRGWARVFLRCKGCSPIPASPDARRRHCC